MTVLFKNKTYKVESCDIKLDHAGNYQTKYFVDRLNGKNVTNFATLSEAIAYANQRAYAGGEGGI